MYNVGHASKHSVTKRFIGAGIASTDCTSVGIAAYGRKK